ncbi:hypothetical protein SEA_ABINGHOST_91 [Mycobacterium phage Abinghost]|uniref:Uncharacterized protein n=2 Tax=Pipefishvirus TaxID=1982899 RepID=A0A345MCS6_9CAUD|nr:hypothetical protein SEA_TYDOLLA_87 [Mycobacterium phage Tydolla]QGH76131.1 hypothetical protein SEA_ABINGHOST_91 [Mycobacterium phage Abinghost]
MDPPGRAEMTEAMLFETTAETTAEAAKLDVIEFPVRLKRGTVKGFGVKTGDTRVVVARSHKVFIEAYGADKTYLVNDWQAPLYDDEGRYIDPETSGKHTYVRTLKEARAIAERKVREGVAAGVPARW